MKNELTRNQKIALGVSFAIMAAIIIAMYYLGAIEWIEQQVCHFYLICF